MMMIRYEDQYKEDKERGARIAGVIIVLLTFFFYNLALLPLWLEFGERLMLIWVRSQLREAGNFSSYSGLFKIYTDSFLILNLRRAFFSTLYHFDPRDAFFMKEGYWSKRVDVQRTKVQSSELSINLISQEYGNTNSMINVYIQHSLPWFIQVIFLIQQCLTDSAIFHRPIEDDSWFLSAMGLLLFMLLCLLPFQRLRKLLCFFVNDSEICR